MLFINNDEAKILKLRFVFNKYMSSDGDLDFTETKITALAACSLPGFLYSWYRPDGRLSPEEVVIELTKLASRVIGLRSAKEPR